MTDKELIKEAIKKKKQLIWPSNTGEMKVVETPKPIEQGWLNCLKWIEDLIDSLPEEHTGSGTIKENYNERYKRITQTEQFKKSYCDKSLGKEEPASEDLEEEYNNYFKKHEMDIVLNPYSNCKDIAHHFAEWQKQQDEELFKDDSWNYIEELYPNTSQEEKLRLYDISIKSRLAGANTIKQHMKEALQTEYEKGRFDMREKMMKALIGGEVVKDMHNQLSVKSEPLNNTFGDIKFGEKVKIIIIKPEQQ